jgi:protein TonB
MNGDGTIIQGAKVVKKQKALDTREVREEIRGPEKPQIIEEKPKVLENKIVEPTVISNKAEAIHFSVPEEPNPPKAEVRETASAPQISPHDVEFGAATGPKFLHKELPVYPMIARRLGKEGKVVLRLTIDKRGKLLNVEVIENTGYGFTEAAIEAVKRSTFLPAKRDEQPIISRALLPIRFTLLENASPFRSAMKK